MTTDQTTPSPFQILELARRLRVALDVTAEQGVIAAAGAFAAGIAKDDPDALERSEAIRETMESVIVWLAGDGHATGAAADRVLEHPAQMKAPR